MEKELVLGLISDTHGLIRPAIHEHFSEVDAIIHAGDIGSTECMDELLSIAPVHAICGNVDYDLFYPHELILDLEDWRLFVIHSIGSPRQISSHVKAAIIRHHPDIIVFGHTHEPYQEMRNNVYFVNPGSAGPRRFQILPSIAVLKLYPGKKHSLTFISL